MADIVSFPGSEAPESSINAAQNVLQGAIEKELDGEVLVVGINADGKLYWNHNMMGSRAIWLMELIKNQIVEQSLYGDVDD